MDHIAARTSAVTAVLRRAVVHRAVHRLLLLAGLVAAGWLIGGAAQAFADSAPSRGTTVAPAAAAPGGLLHAPDGIVRGASAVLGDRPPVPAALATAPRGGTPVPLPGHPALSVTPASRPSVPPAQDPPEERGTSGVDVTRPGAEELTTARLGRTVSAGSGDAVARTSTLTRRTAAGADLKITRAHVRRSVTRTVHRGANTPVTPVAPAPAQATGASAPAAGPVLFGGFGGVLLRRSWTPRRPGAVLLRVLNEVPPAVRGAADEPSFAPD
ncbi:hypothetical protein [Actinomadura harenae]|uniref:Uncharacterized protein n=1 Tax=Actinomadura harenae TaxID=2483351 RepID=A0A3M2M8H2_9ACTN|nr:hypothetical protein [Actinomadura harenae]RMI45280.1 hypothetical protein EBO15_10145 [Actinomadura harenae]